MDEEDVIRLSWRLRLIEEAIRDLDQRLMDVEVPQPHSNAGPVEIQP